MTFVYRKTVLRLKSHQRFEVNLKIMMPTLFLPVGRSLKKKYIAFTEANDLSNLTESQSFS